jgi:hypothetical protein
MEEMIRKEIRKILRETAMGFMPAYPHSGGANRFPYGDEDSFVSLPEDIETKEDYLVNWEEISENQDLYGFPIEEFKKGIHVEKAKRNLFNILDLGEIVINNLKQNPQFYSNLGV